jgi:hypothetical protein
MGDAMLDARQDSPRIEQRLFRQAPRPESGAAGWSAATLCPDLKRSFVKQPTDNAIKSW